MYRAVSFRYAQPIEWEYDEQGYPVRPGGRALAEEIRTLLTAAGCRMSEVEQHEDYGWGFSCRVGKDYFYNVLDPVDDDVYLTIEMEWYQVKRLLLRKPLLAFDRYCGLVGAALALMAGLSEIHWDSELSLSQD